MKHLCVFVVIFLMFISFFSSSVRVSCISDYSQVDGNLIQNPYFECDEDMDSVPDGWYKRLPDSEHILTLVDDPVDSGKGKVIKSQFTGTGEASDFGFMASNHVALLPNTWYELTITYMTENVGLNLSGNNINVNSNWIGAAVQKYNSSDDTLLYFPLSHIYASAQTFSAWDDIKKVFRTYSSVNNSLWVTKTIYFETSKFDQYAIPRTFNYPKGTLYIAEYILKKTEGNIDPTHVDLNRSGRLNNFKYKGQDFFPIILNAYPKTGGVDLDINQVKTAGFNTMPDSYRSMYFLDYQTLLSANDLGVMIYSNCLPYSDEESCSWANDPTSQINYQGYYYATLHIDDWKDFDGVVLYNSLLDEMDCNPQDGGTYIHYLDMYTSLISYIRGFSSVPIYGNFCGGTYTNVYSDFTDNYLNLPDAFSLTANTHNAYDIASGPSSGAANLPKVGYHVRQDLQTLKNSGRDGKALAFGLGTYWWSSWDGNLYSQDEFIPYNLQRFQIWDQIINGATGVLFFLSGVNLDNTYYNYQFNQVKAITSELNNLNEVLLEPYYIDEWQVSDPRVEIMMKKHKGKIYLFAASTAQDDLNNVKITLDSKYKINSINAVNDIVNGDFANPIDRKIIQLNDTSFYDDFVGENSNSPQGYDAKGYGVHIYEISYQDIVESNFNPVAGPFLCNEKTPQKPFIFAKGPNTSTSVNFAIGGYLNNNLTGYSLLYGTKSGEYKWGLSTFGNKETREFNIKSLSPNTNYYISLRSQNGCAISEASDELLIKTSAVQDKTAIKKVSVVTTHTLKEPEKIEVDRQVVKKLGFFDRIINLFRIYLMKIGRKL